MLKKRLIPTLLIENEVVVKTKQFKKPTYIGDPVNTVRIFNELEVDELILLDIEAYKNNEIKFKLLNEIARESFMPLVYGGGIQSVEDAKKIFDIGFEKISINSVLFSNLNILEQLSQKFGNQAIVCSIDVKKDLFGKLHIWNKNYGYRKKINLKEFVIELEHRGSGEILLTFVDNEGMWCGLNIDTINKISNLIDIPLIGHGGIGSIEDIKEGLTGNLNAIGIGSFIVYQKKDMGVLINFPKKEEFESLI